MVLSQYAINKINKYVDTLKEQLSTYLNGIKSNNNKFSYLVLKLKDNEIEWLTKTLLRPEVISYLIHIYDTVPVATHTVHKKKCSYYLGISGFVEEGNEKKPRNIGLFAWTPNNTKHILITYPFFSFGPKQYETPQSVVDNIIHNMQLFLDNKEYKNQSRNNFYESAVYKKRRSMKKTSSTINNNNGITSNESNLNNNVKNNNITYTFGSFTNNEINKYTKKPSSKRPSSKKAVVNDDFTNSELSNSSGGVARKPSSKRPSSKSGSVAKRPSSKSGSVAKKPSSKNDSVAKSGNQQSRPKPSWLNLSDNENE